MSIQIQPSRPHYEPLDRVTVHGADGGSLVVYDGNGDEYRRLPAREGTEVQFSGALGTHLLHHVDEEGRVLATAGVPVDTETRLDDGGRYQELLTFLFYSMVTSYGGRQHQLLGGKIYQHFISWVRDHTHTLKGMKWFEKGLKTGFELWAERQRADGMVWDRIYPDVPYQKWRDYTFRHGDFVTPAPEDGRGFQRIPVENDVEYLFVECLYRTWQVTGDTDWMTQWLDHAIRAVRYGTSDRYRWSEQYQLLKRGYTIDTWDFLHDDDGSDVVDENGIRLGDNVVLPEKTHFGVFHGDNTGMAQGCVFLAEMLRVAGREEEATRFREMGRALQERLNELSWNGEFFRHWVEETPGRPTRDSGATDEARQVSLSNTYALSRQLTHEQCVAIIETYRRIRREMPGSSPGEWYNLYPPFEKGFSHKWDYMNGGVSTIAAGELAFGAFEHGFEDYAVDILDRLLDLAGSHGGRLDVVFKGCRRESPETGGRPVDLRSVANADFRGDSTRAIPWSDEGGNDLRNMPVGEQTFGHVTMDVIDPEANEGRAAIGLGRTAPYAREAEVPVGRTCRGFYLLHTVVGGGGVVGTLTRVWADGERSTEYVQIGRNAGSWFMPGEPTLDEGHADKIHMPRQRLAWRGPNPIFDNVGVWLTGFDNPRPEVTLEKVIFRVAEQGSARWFILGMTTSDAPCWFPTSDVSFGIPTGWGAAAVVYALLEGLAGIQDAGVAFDTLRLRPRWSADDVDAVHAVARYPDSRGYAAYRFRRQPTELTLEVASCARTYDAALLLPADFEPASLHVNEEPREIHVESVENSRYLRLPLAGVGPHRVRVRA